MNCPCPQPTTGLGAGRASQGETPLVLREVSMELPPRGGESLEVPNQVSRRHSPQRLREDVASEGSGQGLRGGGTMAGGLRESCHCRQRGENEAGLRVLALGGNLLQRNRF